MTGPRRQRGVALFTAIFLIVVIAAVAAAFALMTTTQQAASARALDADRAHAAALGRLDLAIGEALAGGCGAVDGSDLAGYSMDVECDAFTGLSEGASTYSIYEIRVTASRGDRLSGTLVRRTLRAQVTDIN